MEYNTADEFLSMLESIGWFAGMPEAACEYIRDAARKAAAEEENRLFSPWAETKRYVPLNILIGEQLADIVTIYASASYDMFKPENIITKELPADTEEPASFTAQISFTVNNKEYSTKIKSRYADCLDPEFTDLINMAMYEQCGGLCFSEVHEEYGTIALANREAVIGAKAIGVIPNYDHYWKRNHPERINRKPLLAKRAVNWCVSGNKGKILFYRDNIKIRLSALCIKKASGKWFSSVFNFKGKFSVIKYGTNGTTYNDVSRDGSYLSFRGHYLEVYHYNSDGADEEEVRFDTKVIHRSRSDINGKDEYIQVYLPDAVAWADEMLAHLGLPTGGESFQDFCIEFLRLPVGWIQNIYYNPDAKPSIKDVDEGSEEDFFEKRHLRKNYVPRKEAFVLPDPVAEKTHASRSKKTDPERYLEKLAAVGWFKNSPGRAINDIWKNVYKNFEAGEEYSPWPAGHPVPEAKDQIGDHSALLLIAAKSSYDMFHPGNIREQRDRPLTQDSSFIEFTAAEHHIKFKTDWNENFLDQLNINLREPFDGLGFKLIQEGDKWYLCMFNQDAFEEAEKEGIPMGNRVNYKNREAVTAQHTEKKPQENPEKTLAVILKEKGVHNKNVLTQTVKGFEIKLDELKIKTADGEKVILYGTGGRYSNDIATTVTYLSFGSGILKSYSRNSDHASDDELYFNEQCIYKEYTAIDDDIKKMSNGETLQWARDLLSTVGLPPTPDSFKDLLCEGLQLVPLSIFTNHIFNNPEDHSQNTLSVALIAKFKDCNIKCESNTGSKKSIKGRMNIPLHNLYFTPPGSKSVQKIRFGNVYDEKADVKKYSGKLIFKNRCFEYYKELNYRSDTTDFRRLEEYYFDKKRIARILQTGDYNDKSTIRSTAKLRRWISRMLNASGLAGDMASFSHLLSTDMGWKADLLDCILMDDPDLDLWQLFRQKATHRENIDNWESSKENIKITLNAIEVDRAYAKYREEKIMYGTNKGNRSPGCAFEYSVLSYNGHTAESYVGDTSQELFFNKKQVYYRSHNGNHKNWMISPLPEAAEWADSLLAMLRLHKTPASLSHLSYVLNINSDVLDKLYCGLPEHNNDISYSYFK